MSQSVFSRYFVASLVALGFDFALLSGLAFVAGMSAGPASALAYTAGALLHYVISRHLVFEPGWLHERRWTEFLGFLAVGVIGLLATVLIVEIGTSLMEMPLPVAKAGAVAASFMLNYMLRRRFVFRR